MPTKMFCLLISWIRFWLIVCGQSCLLAERILHLRHCFPQDILVPLILPGWSFWRTLTQPALQLCADSQFLCVSHYIVALHLHTDVWVFSTLFVVLVNEMDSWSSCFLLVIVAFTVSPPVLLHSSLLALFSVAFNLHLPMKTEAVVD